MRDKQYYYIGIILLCLIALHIVADALNRKVIVVRSYPDNQEIQLPYKQPSTAEVQHGFYVEVYQPSYSSNIWHITADDCIEYIIVNNKPVDLSEYSEERLCDYQKGNNFNFKNYLTSGVNQLSIMTRDKGGDYSFDIAPSIWGISSINVFIPSVILSCIFITGWIYTLRRYVGDRLIIISATAAICVWIYSLVNSGLHDRAPDSWGHIEYVIYMIQHFLPPHPQQGWQYYQPPLYYFIAGKLLALAELCYVDGITIIRFFSLFCAMIFQLFGLRLIMSLIPEKEYRRWVAVCFLFAPLMLGLSGRVSNEIMLYAMWSACLFYVWDWYKTQSHKAFAACSILIALGFITKTSILVLGLTLFMLALQLIYTKALHIKYFLNKKIVLYGLIMLIAASSNLSRTLYYKYTDFHEMDILVGNVTMDHYSQWTANSVENLLPGRLYTLITHPFLNYYTHEGEGAHNFWASYIKSLNWGEFVMSNLMLAQTLNVAVGIIVFYSFFLLIWGLKEKSPAALFLFISVLCSFTCHLMFRMYIQTTVSNDARFTYPVIILLYSTMGLIPFLFQYSKVPIQRFLAFTSSKILEFTAIISVIFYLGFIFS